MQNIIEKAKLIKLLIFDVDGVLTDGSLYLTNNNIEIKAFHSHDGLGIKMLLSTGIDIAVITARQSNIVIQKMQSLGIKHVYQGNMDKLPAYEDVRNKLQLKDEQIAYMGDDLADLPCLKQAGLSIAPANAIQYIKDNVDLVTTKAGGNGAAREACDLLMQTNNNLDELFQKFLLSNVK